MKQHIYKIEDSDIPTILSEFSIFEGDVPKLVVAALFNEHPEIYNPAFKANLNSDLNVVHGHTRRFRRLEIAINRSVLLWLTNK
jgi:hypothetical protein